MSPDLGRPQVGDRVLWLFGPRPQPGRITAITRDGDFCDLQFEDGSGRGHVHWSQVVRIGEEAGSGPGAEYRPFGIASGEDVGRPTLGGD